MLGSPLPTSESRIDVVTNVWAAGVIYTGKTSGIDVRHCESFWGLWIQVKKGTEYWNIEPSNTFYHDICPSSRGLPS